MLTSSSLGNIAGTLVVCLFAFSFLLLVVCFIARAAVRNFPRQTALVLTSLFFTSLSLCFFAAVGRCLLYYNPQPSQIVMCVSGGIVAFIASYCFTWLSPKMFEWLMPKGGQS